MSGILGLVLLKVFLGISSLGMDIVSFRFNLRILGLGDHIPDCKGVPKGLVHHWWLSFLTHSNSFRNFNIRKWSLGRKELLKMRVRLRDFLNIHWKEDTLGPPQLGVCKDSHSVHHHSLGLGVVVLAYYSHLL